VVLRVPVDEAPAITPNIAPGEDGQELRQTVQALRAAAARQRAVASIPYVRERPFLRGMTPCEVALSLLCNGRHELDI
jgi:hypothetical protein